MKRLLILVATILMLALTSDIATAKETKLNKSFTAPKSKMVISLTCQGDAKMSCTLTLKAKGKKGKVIFSEKFEIGKSKIYARWATAEQGFAYASNASSKSGFYLDIATKKHYEVDIAKFDGAIGAPDGSEQLYLTNLKYPFLNYLPYTDIDNNFTIDYGGADSILATTNYVFYIQVTCSMAEMGSGKIDYYRHRALDWIRSKGTDPKTLKIVWD